MYYKTSKTSETGERFVEIDKLRREADLAAFEFVKSLGAVTFRPGIRCVGGGISSMVFPEGHDFGAEKKNWRKGAKRGEYMPNIRTQKGKEIQAQMNSLPEVSRAQLNAVIGWENSFCVIGVSWRNPEYVLIHILDDKWEIDMPADCVEITQGEFEAMKEVRSVKAEVRKEETNG